MPPSLQLQSHLERNNGDDSAFSNLGGAVNCHQDKSWRRGHIHVRPAHQGLYIYILVFCLKDKKDPQTLLVLLYYAQQSRTKTFVCLVEIYCRFWEKPFLIILPTEGENPMFPVAGAYNYISLWHVFSPCFNKIWIIWKVECKFLTEGECCCLFFLLQWALTSGRWHDDRGCGGHHCGHCNGTGSGTGAGAGCEDHCLLLSGCR